MRILVLCYEYPPIGGGGGTVAKDIAETLVQMGNKVTIVTMAFKELPYYEKNGNLEIYRVKCIRKSTSVCHAWEQLIYVISAIHFLKKHLKEHTYDVCHTHFIVPTGMVSLYIKRKFGLEYVITAHGSDVEGYNTKRFTVMHKLIRGTWKKIVLNAKAVVSPSEYLKGLMKKSCEKIQYQVIPNGVRTELYKPLDKEKIILVMCRLQETKAVDIVIKAFAEVDAKGWKLHILGDGPKRRELEKLAQELGVEKEIVFHGWVENKGKEHLQMLGKSSIYVSASRFENSPVSVLEAIAAGAYPILSDIPGHRLILDDERYIVPVDGIEALKNKMQDLINRDEIQVDFSIEQYDLQRSVNKYVKVMTDAIPEK